MNGIRERRYGVGALHGGNREIEGCPGDRAGRCRYAQMQGRLSLIVVVALVVVVGLLATLAAWAGGSGPARRARMDVVTVAATEAWPAVLGMAVSTAVRMAMPVGRRGRYSREAHQQRGARREGEPAAKHSLSDWSSHIASPSHTS